MNDSRTGPEIRLNIVFMGTPEFAVPCLERLVHAGHRVSLVITQPDRPKGRGKKPTAPPVKIAASRLGCPVLQPLSVRSEETLERIAAAGPDAVVVVAFGQILPERLLRIPALGSVNVHASLLPRHRGPAPIPWAILGGDAQTGVTTMLMDPGLDTGDILLQEATPIGPEDTAQTLHDRLSRMGAELLQKTLAGLAEGSVRPVPQDSSCATHAPMLKKSDGAVDWTRPASRIQAMIRAMTPWPGAFTFLRDRRIKLLKAAIRPSEAPSVPGTVVDGFFGELTVATGEGDLIVLELQPESGKPMAVADFLRGCPVPEGTVLTPCPHPA